LTGNAGRSKGEWVRDATDRGACNLNEIWISGREDDRRSRPTYRSNQAHKASGCFVVEASGWFIDQQDFGAVDQRSRQAQAAALRVVELRNPILSAATEADPGKQLVRLLDTVLSPTVGGSARNGDIPEDVEIGKQPLILEYKADATAHSGPVSW